MGKDDGTSSKPQLADGEGASQLPPPSVGEDGSRSASDMV
jgi:hypothetical protein